MSLQLQSRIQRIQQVLGVKDDGVIGPQTIAAAEAKLGIKDARAAIAAAGGGPFPLDNDAALRAFYGEPGNESSLVRVQFPYPMELYERGGKKLTSHRCHKKVADSLRAVLQDILDTYGEEWIAYHGLNVFGGIYNFRQMRGGRSLSRHSWGIAIDLNPNENSMHTPWRAENVGRPGWASMPAEAIEIFEKHGWKSGARAWGKDAMHFQATQ